ncbi:glutamate cyclase domain-containing protein [Mesorhizobium sp. 1B3]|uniref:glutamate cyclase domain-containing protein n=1 Tax=Mesorhizobium sp. 1B3 TaxID=3243599 RepID=UPI003D9836FE
MPDITGEAIDKICTIEAKNRGMPIKVLAPMYDAARKLVGNRPITMVAAEKLKAAVGKGDSVMVLTGAGYAPQMPFGESDGPPGAAAIARALYRGLGAVPAYVLEECHAGPVVASSHAIGLMVKEHYEDAKNKHLGATMEYAPKTQTEVEKWANDLLDKYQPKALISAERIGPGKDGVLHTATGIPFYDPSSPSAEGIIDISPIVTEATKRGILTIGIGDHGNEIGFGAIREIVVETMPKGESLGTTTACDIVLPVMMSNWGCYGIEAALAYLLQKPDIIHTPAQEERMLRACLDAGGLEAMWCTTDFIVDGLEGETSMAVMQFLGNIVRKNLEEPTRGLAH